MSDAPLISDDPLVVEADGPIATITLNRPKALNALDVPMANALEEAVIALQHTPDLRVIILKGAGRGFMAGGDLGVIQRGLAEGPEHVDAIMLPLHRTLIRLAAMSQPVIASLHGPVAGAGMSVALAADLAIAADDAKFTLAYARIGTTPDGGATWHLPRLVGLRKALEIALLADTIDAQEALRLNLINQVVPAADLATATTALAQRLATGPTQAYARIKRLLRESLAHDLPAHLDAERQAFHESMKTNDFAEGVTAFLAKRPPGFKGT